MEEGLNSYHASATTQTHTETCDRKDLHTALYTQVSEVGNALPQSPEGAFRTQAGVKPLQRSGGNLSPEGAAEHSADKPVAPSGLALSS